MPKSIVPAIVAGAIGFFTGGWPGAARAFFTTLAVSAVSRALAKKPKDPNPVSQVGAGAISIRQPIAPWQVMIGRTRAGGILTFRYISPDRKYWHMVLTIACHRIQSIEEVWFNDEKLVIAANGDVSGKYSKIKLVSQRLVATIASSQVVVGGALAGVHDVHLNIGRGLVLLQDVSPAAPSHWQHYSRSGNTFTFHAINNGREAVIRYFTAEPSGGSWARVKWSLGDEGTGVQPFPDLVAESNGAWTNDHKQYGHAKIYVRLEANNDVFPTGVPQVTVIGKGALLYDPRTGTSAYSNNAALAVNYYLTQAEFGLAAVQADEIHANDLTSAANSSDDAIAVANGGTEPRYTVNGSFLTSEQPKAVLERMLAACAGSLVSLGDKWHINVGVYHVPTVSLGLGDLAGPSVVAPMLSSRDDGNANAIKGVFTNPQANWQPDDFPPLLSNTYLADDNNERRYKDIDLTTFVTSVTQAQRLAKIELLRLRQGLTESATLKMPAWQVVPGRTVNRVDADMVWNPKAFEVEATQLSVAQDQDGNATLQMQLELRETSAAIYDWSTSEEQAEDFAPNTSLPEAGDVPAPGAPVITEALVETRSSRGLAVRVTMSWTASTSPFVVHYQAEYSLASVGAWKILPLQLGTSLELQDFVPGRYDFRIKAIDPTTGASSDYSTSSNVEIVGGTEIPADLTGLSLQAAGGLAVLRWDLHPALDVREGGGILFRHSAATDPALAIWEESFSIGERVSGQANQASLPLKPGTYLARPIDSGERLAANPTKIASKQASIHAFVNVATLQEDTSYAGTHDGTVATDGLLKLVGAGLFDSIPDLDAMTTPIDSYGGVDTTGTYTFASGLDLGSVQSVRLTSQIEGVISNVNTLMDTRTGNIDDWDDFDGTDGASADVYVEARETDDDPASSPAWSTWKRLDAAEFNARGFEFRAQLLTSDVSYNVLVSKLRVAVAQVY